MSVESVFCNILVQNLLNSAIYMTWNSVTFPRYKKKTKKHNYRFEKGEKGGRACEYIAVS